MSEAPQLLLDHHLKTLKLPTFLREYSKVARQCAAEGLDHVQFLARLVELEMIDRERRMIERRIKAASRTNAIPMTTAARRYRTSNTLHPSGCSSASNRCFNSGSDKQ